MGGTFRDGVPRICDFGLSKILSPANQTRSLERKVHTFKTFTYLGTQECMAPEVAFEKDGYSWGCDHYSFGLVLLGTHSNLAGCSSFSLAHSRLHTELYAGTDVKQHPSVQARKGEVVLPPCMYKGDACAETLQQLRELIGSLLEKNPHKRLGYTAGALGGVHQIQQHPFIRDAKALSARGPKWQPSAANVVVADSSAEFVPAAAKDTDWVSL
jgi:serine/threonine protein kinase